MEEQEKDVNENEQVEKESNTEEEVKKPSSGSNFYKQKLAEVEADRQKLAKALEETKTKQLQEKENFKELWELEKQKRIEAEEKSKTLAKNYFEDLKIKAIEKEAIKHGMLSEALEDINMLDYSMVEIETTSTGRHNVLGATEYMEQLKAKKPHWFKKAGAPNINNAMPGEAKKKDYTASELIELQKTDKAKYLQIVKEKYNIA